MLEQGATSLAEMWDFQLSESHNHAMFGHIEEWFYEYLGGIQFSIDSITFFFTRAPLLLPLTPFLSFISYFLSFFSPRSPLPKSYTTQYLVT